MEITGSGLVTSIFGYWPSFHDAEVVRLELARVEPFSDGPECFAEIHAFEITDQVGEDGAFRIAVGQGEVVEVRAWLGRTTVTVPGVSAGTRDLVIRLR